MYPLLLGMLLSPPPNVMDAAYAPFRSNREVAELFDSGFGIHHAGMLRADRTLTERLFSEGLIKWVQGS